MHQRLLFRPLFPILLALSSAACSGPDDPGQSTGTAQASAIAVAQATGALPSAAASVAAGPVAFADSASTEGDRSGSRKFSYSWPAAVSAIPALAQQLTQDRDKALADQKAQWKAAQATSVADCPACRSFETSEEWQVVAALPQWLSLSDKLYTYTGGAHGMSGLRSLVWDKAAGRALDGKALFRSPAALQRALGSKLCAALDRQRAKKRGEPVPGAGGPLGFDNCPELSDATILPGSSSGTHFDRIGIWFGPYVAGPYAEGSYELTFPVDAAVIDAVKPEYAGAFAIAR